MNTDPALNRRSDAGQESSYLDTVSQEKGEKSKDQANGRMRPQKGLHTAPGARSRKRKEARKKMRK